MHVLADMIDDLVYVKQIALIYHTYVYSIALQTARPIYETCKFEIIWCCSHRI